MHDLIKVFVLGVLAVVLILVAGSVRAPFTAQNAVPSSTVSMPQPRTPAPGFKRFRSAKYGFEFQYPNSWTAEGDVFTFTTHDGRQAWFKPQSWYAPSKNDQTIEELRREYDREHYDRNAKSRTAAEALKSIVIGSEPGLEEGHVSCETFRPCYAHFTFWSNALSRIGVQFALIISPLQDKEVYIATSSVALELIVDPHPLFEGEIDIVHRVLATFKSSENVFR